MKHEQQVVIKRWIPILKEYEKTRAKIIPRAFKSVKLLCEAHHISPKELRRYYTKWIEVEERPFIAIAGKRGAKARIKKNTERD